MSLAVGHRSYVLVFSNSSTLEITQLELEEVTELMTLR